MLCAMIIIIFIFIKLFFMLTNRFRSLHGFCLNLLLYIYIKEKHSLYCQMNPIVWDSKECFISPNLTLSSLTY